MPVTLDKVAPAAPPHIHVGHNMPGYLPESDVMCFSEVDGALDALRHEIKDRQDSYYEACPDHLEYPGNGYPECDWCSVAGDAEAALSAIADGDAAFRIQHGQRPRLFGIRLSPPEGPDLVFWAEAVTGDREACEIAQEQDA